MRHQVKGRKLGRTTPHRKATLQALGVALIKEKRINTTLPKAKELRTFIEPVITKAKTDTTHNRRQVFAKLRDKYAVTELFDSIIPEVGDRPGGYTRVIRTGTRLGDAAEMAMIELVDFNDVKPDKKEAKKKRTRRAGKSVKPAEETAPKEKKTEKKEEKAEAKAAEETAQETEVKAEEAKTETAAEETVEQAAAEKEEAPKAKAESEEKAEAEAKAKSAASEAEAGESEEEDTSDDTSEEKK
jgi:large subunit ribosomal protein L17